MRDFLPILIEVFVVLVERVRTVWKTNDQKTNDPMMNGQKMTDQMMTDSLSTDL